MINKNTCGVETAFAFQCKGEQLFGVLHEGVPDATVGVLIVVGGRQYRAGAHRQFVLLARYMADHEIPVLRFDVRGMGDSDGQVRHFLSLDDDIAQAVAAFRQRVPSLQKLILWGLCDGASAAILYARSDSLIAGVMLVNPWISTDSGVAKTYLRHYYHKRLTDPGFWRKVVIGGLNWRRSVASLRQHLRQVKNPPLDTEADIALPDIIFNALSDYTGAIRLVISERDFTAREFEDEYLRRIDDGRFFHQESEILFRIKADHTFSKRVAHVQLCEHTLNWVQSFVINDTTI